MWINNIGSILEQRDLKLYQILKKNTVNKTLMDYVNDYTINKKLLQSINHIRWYKGVYLPFELVSKRGGMMTDTYINVLEQSAISWNNEVEEYQDLMGK